jgi:hypothetical protein
VDCFDCFDCFDCYACSGCHACYKCSGLYKNEYCILNVQLTKEEYEAKMKELLNE